MEQRLWHWPVAPFVAVTPHQVRIRLMVTGPVPVPVTVWLRAEPNNEEWLTEMTLCRSGERCWYEAVLPLNPAEDCNRYCFKVSDGQRQRWLGAAGEQGWLPPRDLQFKWLLGDSHPAWLAEQVIYQIFPDRFARGAGPTAPFNHYIHNKGHHAQLRQWQDPISREGAAWDFWGGNLWGIIERLDYLQQLGVSCLYLTPIFTAPSPHRYDVADYYQVDHHLGGNAALIELRRATAERGMRLILDGVFNHSGDEHPWFNRHGTAPTTGACQGEDSPFRQFYTFGEGWPGYQCWNGRPQLPMLNYGEAKLRWQIFEGPDAVVGHWLKPPYAIDGWRLDAANMIGEGGTARANQALLRGFRQTVKAINRQACLLGEHWNDASGWLQGDGEDGCMNYHGFNLPLMAFFCGQDQAGHPCAIDGHGLLAWLDQARQQWPAAVRLAQFNHLGGADLPRWQSRISDHRLQRLALLLLFTLPGVPAIYYGDELAMEGGADPFNRAPVDWSQLDRLPPIWHWHQQLIGLRRDHIALRQGEWWPLAANNDGLAFVRIHQQQLLLVAINRHLDQWCELTLDLAPLVTGGHWSSLLGGDALSSDNGLLSLRLEPAGGGIWQYALQPFSEWR